MKLIPAPGGREIQDAHTHRYVRKIVNILLLVIDQEFFEDITRFLNLYDRPDLPKFAENLQGLCAYHRSDLVGEMNIVAHPYMDELIETLEALYQQDQKTINAQRGAIVELLAFEPIQEHCNDGECFDNHRFIDEASRYKSDQIDIAVLSKSRQQIEGYECKMKPEGIASIHCTNLTALANKAEEVGYDAWVGFICFENSQRIQRRLQKFLPAYPIHAYGLDNMQELRNNPFERE